MAISRKRCKIGGKLLLITNRKSSRIMRFRLVPRSVILSDLERCNGRLFCVISPNSVASGPHCVKVIEDVVANKFTFAMSSPVDFRVVLFLFIVLPED